MSAAAPLDPAAAWGGPAGAAGTQAEGPDGVRLARREWGLALGLVFAIKLAFLLLDPHPRFFMGDSVTYLETALVGSFPRDRSFVYGGLIWLFAVLPRSLHTLVAAQAAAGVAGAMLVFWITRVLLRVRFGWALAAAALVALEPAQLFYERMIMAEAFGSVAWLGFVGCVLAYAQRGRLAWLASAVLLGIVGASLRQNAILVAVVVPPLIPWLRWRALASMDVVAGATAPAGASAPAGGRAGAWRVALLHSLVALVATSGLHVGYRHLVGHYAHSAPGYVGLAGPFELGLVVPLVRPEHFAGTACPPDILQRIGPSLSDPWLRELHIWRGDGLWPTMRWRCKDPEDAARIVADRALKSDPLGLLPLAWATIRQHFDEPSARWRMDSDLGRNWLGDDFVFAIRELFGFDPAPVPFRDTITSRAFDASRWWLTWAYFLTPAYVAALAWRARRRRDFPAQVFALMTGLLVGSQLLFSHILSYRYLYAFPVLLIVAVAWWFGQARGAASAAAVGEAELARAA